MRPRRRLGLARARRRAVAPSRLSSSGPSPRGTPALGVGVGNAVVTVDASADLDDAADKIVLSKTLDLAASCSSDNALVVLDAVYDEMLAKVFSAPL